MAKKFRFRAEAVLRLREQREQAAQRKLAEAQGQVGRIESAIADLRADLARQDQLVREGVLTGRVDVQYMSLYRRHAMTLHRALIGQAGLLREATAALRVARAELVSAARERKVLQTLRDRQHAEHLTALRHAEQFASDDMTTTRYARQLAEGEVEA